MDLNQSKSDKRKLRSMLQQVIGITLAIDSLLQVPAYVVLWCEFVGVLQFIVIMEFNFQLYVAMDSSNFSTYYGLFVNTFLELKQYSFLFVLAILVLLAFVYIGNVLEIRDATGKYPIQLLAQKSSSVKRIGLILTSYINKLTASVLFLPLNQMLISSFWETYQKITGGDLTYISLSTIVIIVQGFFLAYFTLRCLCLEQQLMEGDFNKFFVPLSVSINYSIQYAIILCCTILPTDKINKVIIIFLGLIYLSIYIAQTIFEAVYVRNAHIRLRLYLSAFLSLYLLNLVLSLGSYHFYHESSIVLLIPLLAKALHKSDLDDDCLVCRNPSQHSSRKQLRFARILFNILRSSNTTVLTRIKLLLITNHFNNYSTSISKMKNQMQVIDDLIVVSEAQQHEIVLTQFYQIVLLNINEKDPQLQFTFRLLLIQALYHSNLANQAQLLVQMMIKNRKTALSQDNPGQTCMTSHWKDILSARSPSLTIFQKHQIISIQQQLECTLRTRMEMSVTEQQKHESDQLKSAVRLFFDSEKHNQQIIRQVLSMIDDKLYFMLFISNQQKFNGKRACKMLKALSGKYLLIERDFNKIYQAFPSQRMQSILMFLQTEILHNYLKAWQLCSFATLQDDTLLKLSEGMRINLLKSDVSYLVTSLDEEHRFLRIDKVSEAAIRMFKYSKQEFSSFPSIDPLIPNMIQLTHSHMVQNFLTTGHSKFFRNVSPALLKDSNGYVQFIDMFFEVNHFTYGLNFITFMQKTENAPTCMLVNSKGEIDSVTESLLNDLSTISLAPHKQLKKILYESNVEKLFPFDLTQLYEIQQHSTLLLTGTFNWGLPIETNYYSESSTNPSIQRQKSQQRYTLRFTSFLEVEIRDLGYSSYFIFKISETKLNLPKLIDHSIQHQSMNDAISSIESEAGIVATKMNHMKGNPIQTSQFNAGYLLEAAPILTIEQPLISVMNELQIATPNNHDQQHLLISNPAQQHFYNEDQTNLIITIPTKFKFQHQKSMNLGNQINDKPTPVLKKEFTLQLIGLVNHADKESEPRQQPNQSEQSVASSAAGIRRSEYFKKYDGLNLFITSNIQHRWIQILTYIMALNFALSVSFSIFVILNSNNDLKQIQSEFDTLQVKRLFIESIDQYASSRYTIIGYQSANRSGQITFEEYSNYTIYPYFLLNYTYFKTLENVNDGANNVQLQKFLVDRYDVIDIARVQRDPQDWTADRYNLSIREILQVTLIYQYMFKLSFDGAVTTGGQGRTYFHFHNWNYFVLRNIFVKIGKDVNLFAHSNCSIIMDKWMAVYIPFLLIITLLYGIQWILILGYFGRIDKIVSWFTNVQYQLKISQEIENLQTVRRIIQNNPQIIYQYNFNLEIKEQLLKTTVPTTTKVQIQHYKPDTLHSRRYFRITTPVIILIGLFVAYSTTCTLEIIQHTQKYKRTIDFYQVMSDVSVAIPAMYTQREILYIWASFTFFNVTDRERYLQAIDDNQQKIRTFLTYIEYFNPDLILCDKKFATEFEHALKHSLCIYLNEDISNASQQTCSLAMNKVLQRGLLPTLSYMWVSIQSERAVNNFTSRTKAPILEIEGAFLASQAIDTLHSLLKDSMITKTKQVSMLTWKLGINYIVFQFIVVIILGTIVLKYFQRDFLLYRRSLLLLSPSVLYSDQLERFIRLVQSQDMS